MKRRLLTFTLLFLAGIAAFAQWAEPELPTEYATSLTPGNKYQIKNSNQDLFIGLGAASGHSTVITLLVERDDAVTFLIDYDEDDYGAGYIFEDTSTGLYANLAESARNYDRLGWGMLRVNVSAGGSDYYHFNIETNSDGTFCIQTPYYESTDANGNDVVYSGYWGNVWDDDEFPNVVWGMLDKTDSKNFCNWQLVDMSVYEARYELYEILLSSTEYPEIDQEVIEEATAVYNDASATVQALEEQMNKVNAAIIKVVLGEASPENPADATSLIENPTFDSDISGWTCTFVSGVTATNVGYNDYNPCENTDYTYINHEGEETYPFIDYYIEAWSASGAQYGSTEVSRSIGDAELSQTIRGLPSGTWLINCDAVAVQQSSSYQDHNPVKGVHLYAAGDGWDMYKEIATGDGIPEHYSLTFASDGGTVTLGLRTQTTDANWIAADNFELIYYGDEGTSPYYLALQVAIEEAEKYFTAEGMDDVIAGAEEKANYLSALEAAKTLLENSSSTDTSKNDEFSAAADNLTDALTALQTSVTKYASVASLIEYINEVSDKAESYGWIGLVDELAEIRDALEAGYLEGALTDDEIDAVEDEVTNAIADYISENVQAGDDITLVISNPDFDTDFSGWTVSGTTPTFGGEGTTGGGSNTIDGGIQPSSLGSGDAEVYHATFDISQTIKNLPEGLYTLSCSAFARDDNGDGIQAELYASVDGKEQTQTLVDLYSEGSPEMLYDSSSFPDVTTTLTNGDFAYVPDGMAGANIYFYLGYYQNKFNILVEERGDLTIGVRETSTDDWVIFDNFRLVYQGNDANVYVELIEGLIEQAMETQESGMMSNEADQRIMDAINEGYDALDLEPADKDVSLAAVRALRDAIEAGEASIALILDLEYLTDYTNEVRLSDLESSISGEIIDVIEEVYEAFDGDGFETDAQVQEYMSELRGVFNKCVIYDHLGATEESPADVSDVILTRSCVDEYGDGSTYGWELNDGTSIGFDYECAEIYNQDAGVGISQVLYNLYAGWYRLGVQAFYRPFAQATSVEIAAVEEADTIYNVVLFAGKTTARVLSIYADAKAYSDIEGSTTSTTYAVPNTMEQASYAFDDDLYHNILQFEVKADGTDVEVGFLKTGYITSDWLIWDNWTLQYLGTAEPSENPSTAIESVEGSDRILATAIYGVNGTKLRHLTKGVNIVKSTLSDGTVKVSKVLVK